MGKNTFLFKKKRGTFVGGRGRTVAKIINDPERLKTKSSENFDDNYKEF